MKTFLNKRFIGIAVSAMLLAIVFMPLQQSSAAMSTNIMAIPSISSSRGMELFIMRVQVPLGEQYLINNLELIINEGQPDERKVVFDASGNIISEAPDPSYINVQGNMRVSDGYAVGPLRGIFIGLINKAVLGSGDYTATFKVHTDAGTFIATDNFTIL